VTGHHQLKGSSPNVRPAGARVQFDGDTFEAEVLAPVNAGRVMKY
jgi:hypothetical protein